MQTPPLQVMTATGLIIFNTRFQGGYHLKVVAVASKCLQGSHTCLSKSTLHVLLIINNGHSAAACHAQLGVNVLSISASQATKLKTVWEQAGCQAAKKLHSNSMMDVLGLIASLLYNYI